MQCFVVSNDYLMINHDSSESSFPTYVQPSVCFTQLDYSRFEASSVHRLLQRARSSLCTSSLLQKQSKHSYIKLPETHSFLFFFVLFKSLFQETCFNSRNMLSTNTVFFYENVPDICSSCIWLMENILKTMDTSLPLVYEMYCHERHKRGKTSPGQ